MKSSIKQKTKTLILHRQINRALIALIFAMALFYMYFANAAVRTLSVLEKTKQYSQSLSIEVSELESKRLSVENLINPNKALELGFVEVKNPFFIVKSSKQATLSLKID